MGLPQLKEHHTIWTPELVEIELPLAGLARRCVARVLDQFILGIAYAAILVIAFMLGAAMEFSDKSPEALMLVIGVVVLCLLLDFVYFWFFHGFVNGQTPGKMAVGIRVVTVRGGRINSVTAIIRSLLNFADMALLSGGISAFMILATDQEKRIADFGAGTIVVRNHQS